MKIVFLKLADEKGVTSKAIAALRIKYPAYRSSGLSSWLSPSSWRDWYTNDNKVTEVNLIPLLAEWQGPRLTLAFLDKMVEVSQACAAADKIMLGIHGEPGDTTCGHIDLFGEKKTITYERLAQFIFLFLPSDDKLLKTAFNRGGRAAVVEFRKVETVIQQEFARGRTDWSMASATELMIVDHLRIEREDQRLKAASNVDRGKYGKFIYRYDRPRGEASVIRKYPNPALLYRGAL